jgi:hypothetical protein
VKKLVFPFDIYEREVLAKQKWFPTQWEAVPLFLAGVDNASKTVHPTKACIETKQRHLG